jgi:hypothetical protein
MSSIGVIILHCACLPPNNSIISWGKESLSSYHLARHGNWHDTLSSYSQVLVFALPSAQHIEDYTDGSLAIAGF